MRFFCRKPEKPNVVFTNGRDRRGALGQFMRSDSEILRWAIPPTPIPLDLSFFYFMRTRRDFLVSGATLALTAGLAPATLTAFPFPGRSVALHRISFASFAGQQGANFKVLRSPGNAVVLKLVEATSWSQSYPHTPDVEEARNEKFSLLFRGALDPALEQDTYVFDHPGIGRFAMFIVLIGSTDPGFLYYEAVFNRPLEGSAPVERRPVRQAGNVFAR